MYFWITLVALIIFFLLRNILGHRYSLINSLTNYIIKDYFNRRFLYRDLQTPYKQYLENHFSYYKKLPPEDKILFEKRVQKFIDMKEFTPRGTLKAVTPKMKALIAGTAIQVTFGYPYVYFEHFWRILLYDDNYYSQITRQYHQGEVNMNGIIVLSWTNFVRGFEDEHDGRNLGFHEMAHALRLENAIINGEYNFLDEEEVAHFNYLAQLEMEKIHQGQSNFFREYAGQNHHEFFAVVIENFFERPSEFQYYNPHLYNITTKLLRQNPLAA